MVGSAYPEWELVHHDGELFDLYNRTGFDAADVEVRAYQLQLDGMGDDYVRREAAVVAGGYLQIGLRAVWGTNTPNLQVDWTSDGVPRSVAIK